MMMKEADYIIDILFSQPFRRREVAAAGNYDELIADKKIALPVHI
jgi:hypothetical protein